ncbi:hypothetical protein RR48_10367 [Papilio machaon]|uniref:Uncharacterized protein n=1 Tax=Papilio machaon TaxID=76193 RepID=A0A194RG28_PAPMA|nr:hypothetical protein RR48_10367 [Papilio machaon]
MVGESGSLARRYARPSRESRDGRDCNANVPRTHARLAHHAHAHHAHHAHVRHDNTLDIILKPLIESTQALKYNGRIDIRNKGIIYICRLGKTRTCRNEY